MSRILANRWGLRGDPNQGGSLDADLTARRAQPARAAPHRLRWLAHDQLRLEPKHPIAEPPERPIPLRIERPPPSVIATIHLDHQPRRHGDKVADETPERHLPPKPDAELPTAKLEPQPLL